MGENSHMGDCGDEVKVKNSERHCSDTNEHSQALMGTAASDSAQSTRRASEADPALGLKLTVSSACGKNKRSLCKPLLCSSVSEGESV